MPNGDHAPGFVPGQGYSQDDWDDVNDSPELTDEQIRAGRPLVEASPELAVALRRIRGPQKAPRKVPVSLRVDQRVVDFYRSTGPGWQGRINKALLKAAGLD